ncbi:MAG: alanine--tRNA ligase [Nitrososphaerales archaeon]
MSEKEALKKKFSEEYRKYYKVELFEKEGFIRKRCINCGNYFWTLQPERVYCADSPCQSYEFLGDPPTKKRLDYPNTWKEIEDYFVSKKHTSLRRYPVVCRWRPDLYFTVASIIDFQRIEAGKVVFEFPSNPLIVPQMCLRFNDIPNIGFSGRHYSSFCMIGQHALANDQGYWKDECINLDFELLTKRFGIDKEEIVFIEDVWLGYGAFGYSLEYFVRGLELGNAVFTEFEGSPSQYKIMDNKIIDMGAGLERFTWITQGTPTSYDCVFAHVLKNAINELKIDFDYEFLLKYYRDAYRIMDEAKYSDLREFRLLTAKKLGLEIEELERKILPFEALYAILDHVRSLVFAIADGALPSNTGGGYNLRVILRRALSLIKKFGWNLDLNTIAQWHIDSLRELYPELLEHKDDISIILKAEIGKYHSTLKRIDNIIDSLIKSKKALSYDDMLRLYDSEGIIPEILMEKGLIKEIPKDFYVKVTAKHEAQKLQEEKLNIDVSNYPPTKALFYEDQYLQEFDAKVLGVIDNKYVILDRTAFYPRSGGQEPDFGFLNGYRVINVEKIGNVIIHELENFNLKVNDRVHGKVDYNRRSLIMKHHTATHIVNGAARKVLGPWVWQHSAFKDEDKGRLDITHFAPLKDEEIEKIEDLANKIVRKNLKVEATFLPRGEAEQKYGFRLYQGGIAPGKEIRVVAIDGFDVEACGGTHCLRTGEVGLIKIVKVTRVQDGVERLEYLAGEKALEYIRSREKKIINLSKILQAQPEKLEQALYNFLNNFERVKKANKALLRNFLDAIVNKLISEAEEVKGLKLCKIYDEGLDEDSLISIGEKIIIADESLVFVGFSAEKDKAKIIVFSSERAREKGVYAGLLAKKVSENLGGSGGGDQRFGRGGGSIDNLNQVKKELKSIVLSLVKA